MHVGLTIHLYAGTFQRSGEYNETFSNVKVLHWLLTGETLQIDSGHPTTQAH